MKRSVKTNKSLVRSIQKKREREGIHTLPISGMREIRHYGSSNYSKNSKRKKKTNSLKYTNPKVTQEGIKDLFMNYNEHVLLEVGDRHIRVQYVILSAFIYFLKYH